MNVNENASQDKPDGDSREKRRKLSIPWHGDLPGIDEQISYIKRVRKQIYTDSKKLRYDLRMIHAIEQTLLAARIFFKTKR
jgi:hypothetical protein